MTEGVDMLIESDRNFAADKQRTDREGTGKTACQKERDRKK